MVPEKTIALETKVNKRGKNKRYTGKVNNPKRNLFTMPGSRRFSIFVMVNRSRHIKSCHVFPGRECVYSFPFYFYGDGRVFVR